ncbi:MAG: ribonucleoside-diphosphate reductase subunit alpha, partial [Nitrosarchaeum sp.]
FVKNNFEKIQNAIDYFRDYEGGGYFGFKTLEKSYLLKIPGNSTPLERPQDLWMRVAITVGMNPNNHRCEKAWNHIKETYEYLSQGYYTHASPTLFNSGTKIQQLLSCFLLGSNDSLEGITKTLSDIAKISKRAGGIGFHFDWRSAGSLIRGTGGKSSGPIPFLQIQDKVLVAFNQGGRRAGSGAAYMSIDHPDIEQFIECRNQHKKAEDITPDLFLAVVMRDLFMKRVNNNEDWSLFDPDECPGLLNTYSQEYEQLYLKYEKEGKARKTLNARKLLEHIAKCRLESGVPYIWNIDMSNRKSNQKNLGTIRSSNLCSEIIEYSSSDEYGCCTLASLCLPNYVDSNTNKFNFTKLAKITRLAFRNLNRIIDINDYPCPEAEISNLRHRPLGLGVQGVADLYHKLKLAYNSKEARELNKKIFETIYYATMTESCELAREKYFEYKKQIKENKFAEVIVGYKFSRKNNKNIVTSITKKYEDINELETTVGAYSSFKDSPISQGKFQFDLVDEELEYLNKYNPKFVEHNNKVELSGLWDWESLRTKIKKFGVRNSLCIALMPTASTAQIMGNSESFEPITSNIYRRDVLAGQFICVNKYLINELIQLGVWNSDLENNIIANNGSIQYIDGLPNDMKERYKTVWELSQKAIIDQVADRAPFVDQSQSMNLYLSKTKKNIATVTTMDIYTWFKRLKTSCYYLRTQDLNDPQKFSIIPDKAKLENYNEEYKRKLKSIPIIDEKDICLSCSG